MDDATILRRVHSIVQEHLSDIVPEGLIVDKVFWPKTPTCEGRVAIVRTRQYQCPFGKRVHDSNVLYFLVNLQQRLVRLRCYRCSETWHVTSFPLTDHVALFCARAATRGETDWDAMAEEQAEEIRQALKARPTGPWVYTPVLAPTNLRDVRQKVEHEILAMYEV